MRDHNLSSLPVVVALGGGFPLSLDSLAPFHLSHCKPPPIHILAVLLRSLLSGGWGEGAGAGRSPIIKLQVRKGNEYTQGWVVGEGGGELREDSSGVGKGGCKLATRFTPLYTPTPIASTPFVRQPPSPLPPALYAQLSGTCGVMRAHTHTHRVLATPR